MAQNQTADEIADTYNYWAKEAVRFAGSELEFILRDQPTEAEECRLWQRIAVDQARQAVADGIESVGHEAWRRIFREGE